MSTKRTSSAFMTSVILHIIIALVAGLYFLSQTQDFKNLIGVDILQASKPRTPPRPPHIKPQIHPTVREHSPLTEELVSIAKREVITSPLRSGVQPQATQDIVHRVIKISTPIQPNVPTVVTTDTPVPRPVTSVGPLTSDAPEVLEYSAPVKSGLRTTLGTANRGIAGVNLQYTVGSVRIPGLSMVESVGAAREAEVLADVTGKIRLGNVEVPPLPRGEPGGEIIGTGYPGCAALRSNPPQSFRLVG